MEKGNKKTMTVNDLAVLVAKGFENVVSQMATKKDLEGLATKKELEEGFAKMGIRFDFIEMEIESLRKDIAAVAKRTKEDDAVFVKDIIKLRARVEALEKQVKKLKAKRAA